VDGNALRTGTIANGAIETGETEATTRASEGYARRYGEAWREQYRAPRRAGVERYTQLEESRLEQGVI
jgi:hypothetical protein